MKIFLHVLLRNIIIAFFLLSLHNTAKAQNPVFNWGMAAGDSIDDIAHVITIDSNKNVYIAGTFRNTIDFDPGPGVYELHAPYSWDMFLLKLDSSGHFIWVKHFMNLEYLGTGYPSGLAINNNGEMYLTGYIMGTVDFDPGPGSYDLTEYNWSAPNAIVAKLDTAGNFIWAEMFGAFTTTSITLDNNQHPVLTGYFEYTADFDPGPGTYMVTEPFGLFVMRINPNGGLSFVRSINCNYSFGDNNSYEVAVGADNSIYFTGSFSGIIDADPGPGVVNLTAAGTLLGQNSFLMKLNAAGDFQWVKQIGTGADNKAYCMKRRSNGNILIGGYFNGTADFDPGPGSFNLATTGNYNYNGYLVELDASGNFIWAKQLVSNGTGSQSSVNAMALDANDNIYAAGWFSGPATDFDPGPGSHPVGNGGYLLDGFILKLDNTDAFQWVGTVSDDGVAATNESDQKCNALVVDNNGSIYFTGQFARNMPAQHPGTADLDPCTGHYVVTPVDYWDFFVARWDQYTPSLATTTISANNASTCAGNTVVFTANPVNAGPNPDYQWQINSVNAGTNSNTFSSNALNNGDQVQVIVSPNVDCSTTITDITSNIITVTVNSPVQPSVSITSSPATICSGMPVILTAIPMNGGTTPQYQWKKNGINVGVNDPVYSDNVLLDGDIISCELVSNAVCATPTIATASLTMAIQPVSNVVITASASTNLAAGYPVLLTAVATPTASIFAWFHNDVLLQGLTASTITVNQNETGTYYAVANELNDCNNKSNMITIIDSALSIPFITPNPNSGEFVVRYLNTLTNATRYITIWDSKGAKVFSSHFLVNGREGRIDINAKQLSSGVYMLVLYNGNKKKLKTEKVVIR